MFVEPRGLEWAEEGVYGSGWQGWFQGLTGRGEAFRGE